jgi:ABC-type transport system involved in multi-copper enzyme maturation permease subunit
MIDLIRADHLKLRKRRGLFWWSLILTAGSTVAFAGVKAVLHLTDPVGNGPAGGSDNWVNAMDVLCLTTAVAGALIGATAGNGDRGAGVFRDLVATGRSRVALSLARVPAALALIVPMALGAFAVGTAACFVFASGLPTPSASQIAWYGAFILASAMLTCVLGLGLAEVIGSRGIAIGILLGWFLAGERLVFAITALGDAREGLAGVAVERLRPLLMPDDTHELNPPLVTAVAVLAAWLIVPTIAAAWRAQTRDA